MITIHKLSFAYSKEHELFSKMSIILEPGSITGLLGVNGAGKTTLLKILSGLLSKSSGSVEVAGQNPYARNVSLTRETFFLPEEYLLPSIKISNYVRAQHGFYPKFSIEKFEKTLESFNLQSSSYIHKLSHGQKKKFLVSFALATNCALLIFDEPTNGLDIPSKTQFRKILASSIDEEQLVIISTHQIKDVENLIDNVVILKDGRVVFHHNITTISEKLVFRSGRTLGEETVLYSEPIPGGFKSISMQTNGSASDIDMELLFNAINSGRKILIENENE